MAPPPCSPARPKTASGHPRGTACRLRGAVRPVDGRRGVYPDRINEEYEQAGDVREAVTRGIDHTGRPVTSGALILCLAFIALGGVPVTDVKIPATGLAAGIIIDATVIRGCSPRPRSPCSAGPTGSCPGTAARLLRITPLTAQATPGSFVPPGPRAAPRR